MVRGSVAAGVLALFVAGACQAQAPNPPMATAAPTQQPSEVQRGPLPSPTEVDRQQQAIVAVFASGEVNGSSLFAMFPKSVGSQNCDIHVGGALLLPGIVIAGTCRTEVVAASGINHIVRFAETWDASAFRAQNDPSSGQLSATWSFLVTPAGGVTSQRLSGDFPPQMVK